MIIKADDNVQDEKILKILQKNSSFGMELLINKYAGLVYTIVKNKLSNTYYNSSDIGDCVADIFSEFYLNIHKYDPKISSIKTYLCVLARNNAIDFLRKHKKHFSNISIDDESTFVEISDDITIESKLEARELHTEVFRAVNDLGEPDSSIIIRKFYLGQSSKEIASALNLTVSNVDTRTHRALKKLRSLFGGE